LADIDLKCFSWAWGPTQWRTIISQCPSTIAVLGERPIGFATMQQRDADTWVIGKLGVKQAYRHRGVGNRILESCLDYLREQGALRAVTVVPESLCYPGSQDIRGWLAQAGFKAGQMLRDHYDIYGEQEDGIVWQLVL